MAKARHPASGRSNRAPESVPGRQASRPWLFVLALAAAGLAAYSNSFTGAFMADDTDAILHNPAIRASSPMAHFDAPKDSTLAGRPFASMTFGLNYWLAPAHAREVMAPRPGGGPADPFYDNVWGYHAVNLGIHLLAGLALFGVLRRTLVSPPLVSIFGQAAAPLAFAVSLIWLLHPLQTGSVTYIVQRVESLMGLCYLATLYCAIRAAESGFQRRRWIVTAIVVCALGMGSKEVMASAPIFVALWIWICRPDVPLFGPPRTLLIGLAATWIILIVLVAGDPRPQSVGFGFDGWPWWLYFVTQAGILLHYLRLAFWPQPLVMFYDWMPASSWQEIVPGFIVLGALGVASLVALWKRRPIGLAGALFFLILAPSSSVLPVVTEVAAEHRMYLPLASILSVVVFAGYALRARRVGSHAAGWWRPGAWALLCLAAGWLGWQTYERNRAYESFAVMAQDIVRGRPQNAVARLFVAEQLVREKRGAEAEAMLRTALEMPLPPGSAEHNHPLMRMYLGLSRALQGAHDDAAAELERAVAMKPALAEAYVPLADTYQVLGRLADALGVLDRGIAAAPDRPEILSRAAWLRATSADDGVRDGARAVREAERAVTVTGARDPLALSALAAAYAETGQFERAHEAAGRAIAAASAQGQTGLVQMLNAHQALYAQGRPVRLR